MEPDRQAIPPIAPPEGRLAAVTVGWLGLTTVVAARSR